MSADTNARELNRKAFTAGTFYVITQLLVKGVSFLITPIYTRLVSTEQYGQIKVYESWLLILVPALSLGLYRSIPRAKYEFRDKFDSYVSSSLCISFLSIGFVYLIIFVFGRVPFCRFCGMDALMFAFMVIYTFTQTAYYTFQNREKQCMRYKSNTRLTLLTVIPSVIFSVVMIYWGVKAGRTEHLVDLRTIGFYTPLIAGGVVAAFLIFKSGKVKLGREYIKFALTYSLPLLPNLLAIQIMNQSDKIMIQELVGPECVGIFALGTTVSYIIWIIEEAVWQAWLPWVYEKMDRNEKQDIEAPWMAMVLLFGFISWGTVAVAPEIIKVLGGAKYANAVYLVAPMVTGVLYRFFSYIFSAIQNYYNATKYVGISTVVVMVVNIALNYIFITKIGYEAAAYTTAISYFLLIVIQAVMEIKVCGERIISLRKMLMISVVLLAVNILTMKMFSWRWYGRYFVIILAVALFLWKGISVMKILKDQLKGRKA